MMLIYIFKVIFSYSTERNYFYLIYLFKFCTDCFKNNWTEKNLQNESGPRENKSTKIKIYSVDRVMIIKPQVIRSSYIHFYNGINYSMRFPRLNFGAWYAAESPKIGTVG
ncbi:Uncharacterised protein at_DN2574 [Pycnogonum litorale]